MSIEKLQHERDNLMDDLGREARKLDINGYKIEKIVDVIDQKYYECVHAIESQDFDIDEVIEAYRSMIYKILYPDTESGEDKIIL